MIRRFTLIVALVMFVALLTTAVPAISQDRPRWEAPPLSQAVSVRDGRSGATVTLDAMFDALAQADVVFLGETHTDETTHRVELAVYEALLQRRQNRVVLAMEMFERDAQSQLDAYLKSSIEEATFLSTVRPWNNYRTAYRPMIERARQDRLPVVASNFPRSLRMKLRGQASDPFQDLTPDERKLAPRQLLPNSDAYWRRADNATRGHAAMMRTGGDESRLSSIQSLWDNSMGEACADALDAHPNHIVLHVNGGFHSAYWDGTVHQLKVRKPQATVKTVSIVPSLNPSAVQVEGKPVADFVVLAEARATDLNEGTWSVYAQQEITYRLHLPEGKPSTGKAPLLIWLSDDGFTSTDGLDLWKDRLGEEVVIVVVDAPYRETQSDFSVGGRWFWPDSFAADIGRMVTAVERVWGYVMRHHEIDPARVCIAGEGAGATIVAGVALLADRMDLQAVAVSPARYSKLKDIPLPLAELLGDVQPPRKSLQVIGTQAEEQWWSSELQQYEEQGLETRMVLRIGDPWQRELQLANALRQGLGLEQKTAAKGETRKYLLVNDDMPRQRHWARLHALWSAAESGDAVAVVDEVPDGPAVEIPLSVRPELCVGEGVLPRCPGPFGGTTVIVVDQPDLQRWLAVEENDPLAKSSRFHRVRVAAFDSDAHGLTNVLQKLQSENRKNILVVPGVFCADFQLMKKLRREVRHLENEMTFHWLPGLGGRRLQLGTSPTAATDLPLQHSLFVTLKPRESTIRVRDVIDLPQSLRREGAEFALHEGLRVTASTPSVRKVGPGATKGESLYRLSKGPDDGRALELTYEGVLSHELSDEKQQYTRGFRETKGFVGREGVYLDGGSGWVPRFNDRLVRFRVEIEMPHDWHVISQGRGVSRDDQGVARWDSDGVMEQVYLVGGPLRRYADAAGATEALVFLHEAEDADALARKYLDATARYLEMYRSLIGPYPYQKFALVENYWETGYGMPSFTLLGPQVVRFPFILHSSYPHEILHNWWGNSVFVDYESGNWCEGLTAYLADHLVQQQRGIGAEYRRNTLQKYRNYVREGRDFPLNKFRERHSAATEAVGYGKALMMFHMLRQKIGDDEFCRALAGFYRKQKGKRASFHDLRVEFEAAGDRDLKAFFTQWTELTGAPALSLQNVGVVPTAGGFNVLGALVQTHDGKPYTLEVPVVVQTNSDVVSASVKCNARRTEFAVAVETQPLALHVDPSFDLFRLLDPRETPASIGQVFGESAIVALLPNTASEAKQKYYRELMEAWTSDSHTIELVLDSEIKSLPNDCGVWVLGRENRFAGELIRGGKENASISKDSIQLAADSVAYANHSIVLIRRNPQNAEKAVGLLTVEPDAAFPGMARKLPHYGKYSYLAFEGDEPTNVVKGQWGTVGSPLVHDLRENKSSALAGLKLVPREALAELPPVFSSETLFKHVAWLAEPDRQGRGLGSIGLERSGEYIAQQMSEIGLEPGGDNGTFFQDFTVAQGPDGSPVKARNVIGILPGKREDWKDQSIILGAHYDHLGFGWPDVRAAAKGQLHPGADDNASGVAVMLEMARNLAAEGGGARNLVCVAFSAEECGRWGSKHYVTDPSLPREGIRGAINLDTVGRLFDGKIAIHATATADEWQHIFRGCGFVTGIPNQIVPAGQEGSDQMSFIEAGIPAVQIFTGAHGDYHSPRDLADGIDTAGLVKVATFVKEAVVYMLEREAPLTIQIEGAAAQQAAPVPPAGTGRRVLVGTVPAFDYQGEGVKIDSLVADSPAAQAGLRPGDVIERIDEHVVRDLRGYSEVLKKLKPNQTVTFELRRAAGKVRLKVTVVER